MFGQGGTAVEVVADRALALPPLNEPLARALIERTRVARLLAGWRDVPAADSAAVVGVLTAVSQLLADEPRIAELDINPLLADAQGVIALDARVRVSAAAPGGAAALRDPALPERAGRDRRVAGQHAHAAPDPPGRRGPAPGVPGKLDPLDIRMRIFYTRRSIERSELARLTQIDYEREMAFIATAPLADMPAAARRPWASRGRCATPTTTTPSSASWCART